MSESVLSFLSSSIGRKDELPNIALAARIAKENDTEAVAVLIGNLETKSIQNNCIKVIYEIGEINPTMLGAYSQNFIQLLDSPNNRMVWGAMSALARITLVNPEPIYLALVKLCQIADKGTVITKDQLVSILIKLCSFDAYKESAFTLLMEQLLKSPTNQLPMYAENTLPIVSLHTRDIFSSILLSRLNEVEKETKRMRIEKVLLKLNKRF